MVLRYDPEAARFFFGDQEVLDVSTDDDGRTRVLLAGRVESLAGEIGWAGGGTFEVPLDELVGKPRLGPSSP